MPDDAAAGPADPVAEAGLVALAAEHGLAVDPGSVRLEEMGLDYRVAFVRVDGEEWVLRVPRRAGLAEAIAQEAAVLDAVRPHLAVAVPDWRVHGDRLVAYPLLPGRPGMTIDAGTGEPVWRIDPSSPTYAAALGTLLADLHAIDPDVLTAAGAPVEDPARVRQRWTEQVDRVAAGFRVAPSLVERWRAWIADDSTWPTWSVVTHGEMYPAHVLVDDNQQPVSVLDWTTAKVSDPGRDLAMHHLVAGEEAFALTVAAYEAAGGRTWPGLERHCVEMMAANAVGYGVYALTTQDPGHLETARAMLDPS